MKNACDLLPDRKRPRFDSPLRSHTHLLHGTPHLGTIRETERVLDENLTTTYGRARSSLSIVIDPREFTFPSLRTALCTT